MDRRRAAGALIALAACLATSHAAPTATSNHTALDLYDEVSEGCYYNFQHYGEGDRIMTNEPCLNCTCHNRMLMCYLRVCPFTKAIGQDCTVEKRADQCCPIVTCPDVPVDLLTSTSTSSPAEYGGTGVGKIDKYGCTINGKYFPEGAKVPPTPNKPCEHCYCIRNMTTCVMQECTLHVDGCTPIYHKDVCCPVRYFCDHPEDEMLLLDDMTTTVRPTPGFLLTTIAPMVATEAPETTTLPVRRDCTEGDQLYPDGALIKTDKPCQHCYCMKGDIVCVVQECGTPMENEGKNCTSLSPREGQCCPDTYICEGDESSSEPSTVLPFEEVVTTTIAPPRRVSVEGSGYRNEDEIPYTEAPTFATELEGSGEEDLSEKPIKPTSEVEKVDDFGPIDESEFIPQTTAHSMRDESEKATTEPDKGLNTVPSEEEEVNVKPLGPEQSTSRSESPITEPTRRAEYETTPRVIAVKEQESSETTSPVEINTSKYEIKETESAMIEEPTTARSSTIEQSSEPTIKETTSQEEPKTTEPYPTTERDISKLEDMAESSIGESPTATEKSQSTEQTTHVEKESMTEKAITESSITTVSPSEEVQTTTQHIETDEETTQKTRRTMPPGEDTSKGIEEEKTESFLLELTTEREKLNITEQAISEQNTIPTSANAQESSEPTILEETTSKDEHQSTASPSLVEQQEESTAGTIVEKTTSEIDFETAKAPIIEEDKLEIEPTTVKDNIPLITTESVLEEQKTTASVADEVTKQTLPEDKILVTVSPTAVYDEQQSTAKSSLEPEVEKTTVEPIMELSTFAHVNVPESATTSVPEIETDTATTEKVEIPETTTINEADNEIPPPGRIPGEGDCLLEGVTYKNDSIVPNTNKCHTGCKCVSSIIKCDPIICSSPPEDMDNCQPRYDSPESCCPTYICDHGMETIPPQPESHITGTESPTSYPVVECNDDQCYVSEDKKESTVTSGTIDKVDVSECDNEGCKLPVEVPVEGCTDSKCELPQSPTKESQPHPTVEVPGEGCTDSKCELPQSPPKESQPHPTVEVPEEGCTDSKCELPQSPPKESQPHPTVEVIQETPIKEVLQTCDNPENCNGTGASATCDDGLCPTGVQVELCDKEIGCSIEPEIPPPKTIPELCGSDGECKPISIPEPAVPSCEGESCSTDKEGCSAGQCPSVSLPAQPNQQEAICSGDKNCEKPQEPECVNGKCVDKDLANKFECTGDECKHQQPLLPTQETSFNVPSEPSKEATTTSPMFEGVSTITPDTDGKKQEPIGTDAPELPAQGVTEVSTEQVQKLTESSVTEIAEEETTPPYRESELTSTARETMPQDKTEGYSLEKETERPNLSVESHPGEGQSTESSVPEIETSQPTTLSETKQNEMVTKAPGLTESEGERTPALPEKESEKPQPAVPTAEIPSTSTTPIKSITEEMITETSLTPESESYKPMPEDHKEEVEQISTESPEAAHPESSTHALDTTPQPQVTEGPVFSESASTIPVKESQVPEIDIQTTPETIETEPPYSPVTKQVEDTTPSIPEFDKMETPETYTSKPETSVSEEEQKPESIKPYKPQQTTEAEAPIASDTEPSILITTQEAFTEKAGDIEPAKAPTTEKQNVQPEHPEPTTTEPFEETQSGFGTQTTSGPEIIKERTTEKQEPEKGTTATETSIIEEAERSSEKPNIIEIVSPTEKIELGTEEPEVMHSVKPGEEHIAPVTEAEPTSIEKATQKPEQESTKAQEEFVPQDITKSPISYETPQPEDLSGEGQLSTHEPQKSSTESTINVEFETKQPEFEPTEEVKTTSMPEVTERPILREPFEPQRPETSTEPNEKETGPELHTKEPLAATTELTGEPVTSAPVYPTQANPELSVTDDKYSEEQETESEPSNLPEQPTETPRPEVGATKLEVEQEIPTQTSSPADKVEQSLQTTKPEQQEEPTETTRPEVTQEEPVQTSKPASEQEETAQTSRPEGAQEELAQTTRPEGEQKEPTTYRPESEKEESAQASKPENEQDVPAQTSRPESEQGEPAQTSRPEGELEEPAQTFRPESEQEKPAQTSRPDDDLEEPAQTSKPKNDQEEPTQTSRPEGEQEEPAQTLRPEDEQEEPVQTSKPDLGQEEPTQTSRPEGEQPEPAQTFRPENEQEETVQTSKPDLGQEEPTQTSRPEGEQEEPAQTFRPEDEQEEPVQTSKPDLGQEELAQSSRPEDEQKEPTETSRPEIGQEKPTQTSKPKGEHEEPSFTSKPGSEQEEPTQTSKPALDEEPTQTSKPEIEKDEHAQTLKPEGEQDKPALTSRPDIGQEEPAQTSKPEIEQEVTQTLKPDSEKDKPIQTSRPDVAQEEPAQTSRPESGQEESTQTSRPEGEQETAKPISKPEIEQEEQPSTAKSELAPEESPQTEIDQSETTPYLVELEEHTHKMDAETTIQSSEEPTTLRIEPVAPEQVPTESLPSEKETERPYDHKEEEPVHTEEPRITTVLQEEPETSSEPSFIDKFGSEVDNKEALGTTPKQTAEEEISTYRPSAQTEKVNEVTSQLGQDATPKPISVPVETTAPEEEFIPVTSKATTLKVDEEAPSQPPSTKPEEKPSDMLPSTAIPETSKPEELPPVDEEFPPSGGYNQEAEPDYADEDQAFGPGTCRYGGKVYVSAQQIPRDDPCDFCFCFRSDIICLQQSCPPPIHGCHEEPIQGFCCPRYECPVSMATTLNVTTTTTTTTTTLPPHFLPHAYKGAAQRKGCQIKGHTYQVGEVVRASSGPCLHCTCGGDGQMKCDPKACTPEPMLRQMIAAAVSAKRRR